MFRWEGPGLPVIAPLCSRTFWEVARRLLSTARAKSSPEMPLVSAAFPPGAGSFLEHTPFWLYPLLAGSLLGTGTLLYFLARRRGAPSFFRDSVLIVVLAVPLIAGAFLLEFALAPQDPWRERGRLLVILGACGLSIYSLARLAVTGVRWWATKSEGIRSTQAILIRVVRLLSALVGLLVVLEVLKVPITPLLTTLGVGSLGIALALQDTLSNFFAGLYLAVDRPLRSGDHVKLGSGEEGVVLEIGWRSTRLRGPRDVLVIVPNSKLAQVSITNFDLPGRELAVTVRIPVAYGQDPRRVLEVLSSVVQNASGSIEGLLGSPAPSVAFDPGFGDLAMEFTVSGHVSSVDFEGPVKSELRQRAAERLRAEGLELYRPVGSGR